MGEKRSGTSDKDREMSQVLEQMIDLALRERHGFAADDLSEAARKILDVKLSRLSPDEIAVLEQARDQRLAQIEAEEEARRQANESARMRNQASPQPIDPETLAKLSAEVDERIKISEAEASYAVDFAARLKKSRTENSPLDNNALEEEFGRLPSLMKRRVEQLMSEKEE